MSILSAIAAFPVDPGVLTSMTPVLSSADSTGAAACPQTVTVLTTAVRRGDDAAISELHARYAGRLLRYALVVTRGDESAAAEAVQGAFLKAVRSLRTMTDEAALWAWLARACRTSAADAGRSARRYAAALTRLASCFSRPEPEPPEDTEAVWHDALHASLTELDEESRSLITARYEQRLSLTEIAEARHTSERAIEGRLARLREKLRHAILQTLASRREL